MIEFLLTTVLLTATGTGPETTTLVGSCPSRAEGFHCRELMREECARLRRQREITYFAPPPYVGAGHYCHMEPIMGGRP